MILKILNKQEWLDFMAKGQFTGSAVDLADGFIHFSTPEQVKETAARHFAGQGDLMLVAVSRVALGEALVDEPSRGGALFPHLYAPLALNAVLWAKPLPIDESGKHVFPDKSAFSELTE